MHSLTLQIVWEWFQEHKEDFTVLTLATKHPNSQFHWMLGVLDHQVHFAEPPLLAAVK